jgi:hypothetical protein
MFELLRRATMLCLIGSAVVTYIYVPESITRLSLEDPLSWYEQAYAPQQALGAMGIAESYLRSERELLSPAAFIERHLQGRVKAVAGSEWQERLQQLRATPPADVGVPVGCFYDEDTTPVADVLSWLQNAQAVGDPSAAQTAGAKFVYLRFVTDAGPQFASLSVIGPADLAWQAAPVELRNPLRHYAHYLLTAAGFIYLLPPGPRKLRPDALTYSRYSIVLADLIGTILTMMFFAIPFFIVIGRGKFSALLDFGFDGFGFATAVFWLLAAVAASILIVTAGHAVRQVVLLPDGLRDITWRQDVTVRFDDIAEIRPIEVSMPIGLRRLLWIAGFLFRSPLLISQVLLFGYARHPGLDVHLRNGSQFRLIALPGMERIVEACRAAEVSIVDPKPI